MAFLNEASRCDRKSSGGGGKTWGWPIATKSGKFYEFVSLVVVFGRFSIQWCVYRVQTKVNSPFGLLCATLFCLSSYLFTLFFGAYFESCLAPSVYIFFVQFSLSLAPSSARNLTSFILSGTKMANSIRSILINGKSTIGIFKIVFFFGNGNKFLAKFVSALQSLRLLVDDFSCKINTSQTVSRIVEILSMIYFHRIQLFIIDGRFELFV